MRLQQNPGVSADTEQIQKSGGKTEAVIQMLFFYLLFYKSLFPALSNMGFIWFGFFLDILAKFYVLLFSWIPEKLNNKPMYLQRQMHVSETWKIF